MWHKEEFKDNKQLLDEVEHDIKNYHSDRGQCYLAKLS
jgi:hypothetical protein